MFFHFKKQPGLSRAPSRGFTLLEMLVVVAIFMITTGIVLSNFKGFNRKSSLDLLAREMSLVIRQAQVYGTATRRYEGGTTSGKFPDYGVYLSKSHPLSFILFADKDDNGFHKTGDVCDKTAECVEQFNLYGGVTIESVQGCWLENSVYDCEDAKHQGNGVDKWLNVVFPRPNPGAEFKIECGGGNSCPDHYDSYSYIQVTIKDATDDTRKINVWRTGHIYVESELN